MTLTPAFGRDYKSKADAIADFESGKDFVANDFRGGGGYINKEGCIKAGIKEVSIRYKKLTQVCIVKL